MLMRTSALGTGWCRGQQRRLQDAIVEAMQWQRLLAERPTMFEDGFFHSTRLWEYPWALEYVPPQGRILDIGSNAQWHVALLGLGHEVTAHYTTMDTGHVGMMNCWQQGWHNLGPCWARYPGRFQLVLGEPHELPLQAESFDTIYCLSVIEHVEPWKVGFWLDALWALLAPGGTLCMTIDWAMDYPPGKGLMPYVWNHDLRQLLEHPVVAGERTELPFAYPVAFGTDPDVTVMRWDPVGNLAVCGFAVRKPG